MRNLWLFIKWIALEIINVKNEDLDKFAYKNEVVHSLKINEHDNDSLKNDNDDMVAKKMTMAQLLLASKHKFNIPTYQRDYTWSEKNISKLLNDIETRLKDNKTHYFGALAVAIDNEEDILRIIDGQQRITTSLLIFKAFFDEFTKRKIRLPSELEFFGKKKIHGIYVNQDVLTTQTAIKLILGGINKPIDKQIPQKPFNNMKQIQDWILKMDNNKLSETYAVFTTKFEIASLLFQTTIDNEMDIFENLNTGGTKLTDWDLIRSYIFSKVNPQFFRDNEKIINKKINERFVLPLNIHTNNKYVPPMLTFFTILTRYWSIKKDKIVLKERKSYEIFKTLWPKSLSSKFHSMSDLNKELDEISKIFNIYIQLKFAYKLNDDALHGYAHIISFINRDDVMVLLIHSALRYTKFNNNKITKVTPQFVKIIRMIEAYFIRTDVYGNNLKTEFDEFLLNHKNDVSQKLFKCLKTFSKPMGSLKEFKQTLIISGQLNQNVIMNILRHLEFKLRHIELGKSGYAQFETTHEHIIAQKLAYENYDDKSIGIDKYNELQQNTKNSIGNALLLSRGDNSKAGNKQFKKKMDIYKKSSYLARGNDKIMNLTLKHNFTFKDVSTRAKQIAEYIIKNNIYYDE